MKPLARAGLTLVLTVAGFGYGFLSAKRGLPPHDWLVRLAKRGEEPQLGGGIQTRMENGWFERGRGQSAETKEVLEGLDKLGYGQSYQAGSAEYGVVAHDRARAWQGLNLIVSAHEPNALLADMDGRTLHEWHFAYEGVPEPEGFQPYGTFGERFWRRACVLPGGDLLAIYDRTALIRLDRDSNLRWSLSGGYHHDLDVSRDGTIWVLQHVVHVLPRIHPSEPVFEDFVVHLDADGKVLGRVSLLEAFERSPYAPLLEHAKPSGDIFHTNTLEVYDGEAVRSPLWKEGRALVSIWGLDTVAVVDLEQGVVVWALTGMWRHQHEPVFLEDGHLLVFDNLGLGERSRVLEVDPLTQQVVWSYGDRDEHEFFSTLIGSNQRLPNGNTLITESLAGNAFEVDRAGDTVWRYQSPFRAGENDEGVAVLMEVVRLAREDVADWLPLAR